MRADPDSRVNRLRHQETEQKPKKLNDLKDPILHIQFEKEGFQEPANLKYS